MPQAACRRAIGAVGTSCFPPHDPSTRKRGILEDLSRMASIPSNRIVSRNTGLFASAPALEFRFDQHGLMHDNLGQLRDLRPWQATRWAADTQTGDHASGTIADRRADAADT